MRGWQDDGTNKAQYVTTACWRPPQATAPELQAKQSITLQIFRVPLNPNAWMPRANFPISQQNHGIP